KKVEFEIFRLICDESLRSLCIFQHQANILGYFADCLFKLKSTILSGSKIPDVILEIDENHHKKQVENDDKRQKVIEAFGYRFIRISVNITSDKEELDNIVKEVGNKIKTLLSDLVLQFTPEITTEEFMNVAAQN